jgi:hypothetical protein
MTVLCVLGLRDQCIMLFDFLAHFLVVLHLHLSFCLVQVLGVDLLFVYFLQCSSTFSLWLLSSMYFLESEILFQVDFLIDLFWVLALLFVAAHFLFRTQLLSPSVLDQLLLQGLHRPYNPSVEILGRPT